MPVSRAALVPFFNVLKTALGTQAATTRVSITGGLKMQLEGIRDTKDIDVIVEGQTGGPLINRQKLRNDIVSLDKCFTVNMEGICGVTYRDPDTKEITPIDIISPDVTGFAPKGIILSLLTDDNLPLASPEEIIKMKLLSAPDRFDSNKAMRDLDDAKALVSKFNLTMTYKDSEEKAVMEAALEKFLPTYLENEKGWTRQDWKEKLGFVY
ncbi:hypothetical protein F5887DRAFT_434947 [Amanita rubescens]|nr:hypothetical protein F5887DRAFT_434947 [Amanita rubescens]